MITVGMNYTVLPGKETVFENAFRAVLVAMNEMPGHGRTRLYRDIDRPADYLIVSEWSDRRAFDAFVRSERFAKVTNWGREQVLASRPRHDIYESAARPTSAEPATDL